MFEGVGIVVGCFFSLLFGGTWGVSKSCADRFWEEKPYYCVLEFWDDIFEDGFGILNQRETKKNIEKLVF